MTITPPVTRTPASHTHTARTARHANAPHDTITSPHRPPHFSRINASSDSTNERHPRDRHATQPRSLVKGLEGTVLQGPCPPSVQSCRMATDLRRRQEGRHPARAARAQGPGGPSCHRGSVSPRVKGCRSAAARRQPLTCSIPVLAVSGRRPTPRRSRTELRRYPSRGWSGEASRSCS